jgi:endonuclease/exonuclease/phosphatase family metal-dependent hydrolase
VATLENGATVWTTYPSAGSHLGITLGGSTWILLGAIVGGPIGMIVGAFAIPDVKVVDEDLFKADTHDGPNWWTGNAVQPRVVQQKGAAIIAYQAKEIQKLLFGERTHAWFPKRQFDEVRGPEPGRANVDSGRWFFGRAGDSYVGLFSARETNWTTGGPWQDVELRAEGPTNIFVTQIGTADEFGSFERFIGEVGDASIHVSGLHLGELACSYDVPRGRRLELYYDSASLYGGELVVEDEFPRLLNPYARIAWEQNRYVVQYNDRSVVHDVVAGSRKLGGRLDQLEHDTPLTYYAQNMGLLPWPLYKGADRDRAVDHLIDVLQTTRPDVVGLSEMWTADDRDRVRTELADTYPYSIEGPHDPLLATPLGDLELMGGGLLLLSRHRIVTSSSTVYRQCSGDDCLANKGVLQARVFPRGNPCAVDVFLTHTQAAHPTVAGTTAGARKAVEGQIRHLAAFVRAARDPVGPAVLFGDFNVDFFAHPDLYDQLISTLGFPADVLPTVSLQGRSRPTGTSESDDDNISSFQPDHPVRAADDPARFGDTTERLDYIFFFPGLLYGQQIASADVIAEQWEPGRDMSDHYGIRAFVDTTTQTLPEDRPIETVTATLNGFHCLQTTSGLGDDEVAFALTVRPDLGAAATVQAPETDDVDAGTTISFTLNPLVLGDPGEEIELLVEGSEIDSLSADDSLGNSSRTLRRDELLAAATTGATTIAMPVLRGDGAEYVLDIELNVQAPGTGTKPPMPAAAATP